MKEKVLCSACLLWIKCRFDGKSKTNDSLLKALQNYELTPVCPEQLWWLPTPRQAAEIRQIDWTKKVITNNWTDITNAFLAGSEETLKLAKLLWIKKAILKAKSPSCWFWQIYDWTFNEKLIIWNGITADLLEKNWIQILTENDLIQ